MPVPVRFVLEEHLRGVLLLAVHHLNAKGLPPLDVTQVGAPQDLPRRTPDPDILIWAERNDRLVVTLDRSTMPVHFIDHLAAGRHSPGVVMLRSKSLKAAVTDLETLTYASLPGEWFDRIDYFP
jgi:hypothetical protein